VYVLLALLVVGFERRVGMRMNVCVRKCSVEKDGGYIFELRVSIVFRP
jgi:hypothetical protein